MSQLNSQCSDAISTIESLEEVHSSSRSRSFTQSSFQGETSGLDTMYNTELENHRLALVNSQKAYLKEKLEKALAKKSAALKARYFDWKHKPWESKNPKLDDLENLFQAMNNADQHLFPLEIFSHSEFLLDSILKRFIAPDIAHIPAEIADSVAPYIFNRQNGINDGGGVIDLSSTNKFREKRKKLVQAPSQTYNSSCIAEGLRNLVLHGRNNQNQLDIYNVLTSDGPIQTHPLIRPTINFAPEQFPTNRSASNLQENIGTQVVDQVYSAYPANVDSDDDADTLFAPTPSHARARSVTYAAYPDYNISPQRIRASTAIRRRRNIKPRNPGTKTISQKRLEKDLAEREAQLSNELNRKFKANPIPASSLIPKYHNIVKQATTKSIEERKKRAEALLAKSKPFQFHQREMDKEAEINKNDAISKTINEAIKEIASKNKKSHTGMTPDIVKTACLDGVRRREMVLANEKNAGLNENHTFKPAINIAIPNFTKLQTDFEEALLKCKQEAANRTKKTIFKPFARTETYTKPPQKEVSNDEITKFDSAVSKRWPFIKIDRTSVGKPPASVEPIEVLHTKTSKLKHEIVQSAIEQEEHEKAIAKQNLKDEVAKRKSLGQKIAKAINAAEIKNNVNKSNHLLNLKSADNEYKSRLERINWKLEQRPLLFERESKPKSPKKNIEEEFNNILNNAGLSKFRISTT